MWASGELCLILNNYEVARIFKGVVILTSLMSLTHILSSLHMQQELVYYTLSRVPGTGQTAALSVLLQRCNEVQQWVMSEVLMCVSLNKRVQLLKKFIKIAAQ